MQASLRALAVNDIQAAAAYYHSHAGPKTALEFVEAIEDAINHLRQFPLIGSFRFASELEYLICRAGLSESSPTSSSTWPVLSA